METAQKQAQEQYIAYFVLSKGERFNTEFIATANNVEKEFDILKKSLESWFNVKVLSCSWTLKPQKQGDFED